MRLLNYLILQIPGECTLSYFRSEMGSLRSLQLWVLLLQTLAALIAVATAASNTSLPGCADKCGNVIIPYPFGIGTQCSLSDGFAITCNSSFDPPKPFIGDSNIDIIDVSLNPAQVRINMYIAYNCFNQSDVVQDTSNPWINLPTIGPYRFSDTRNKFTALGCETLAYIDGEGAGQFATGCASFCSGPESGTNGSCTGIGCCQTSIPKNLNYYNVSWGYESNSQWKSVPCSYAMLADTEWYNFSTSDLPGNKDFVDKNENGVPLVLDWAVRNLTCQEGESRPNYACRSKNSYCYDSANGPGYLCNCSKGYEGNPYLDNGCIDIDECAHLNPCVNGTCTNTPASYNCTCPKGTEGDAKRGTCTKKTDKFPLVAKIVIGIIPAIVLLLKLAIWIQKRKYIKEKNECRKKNEDKLSKRMSSMEINILHPFTKKILERATNNFNDKMILGKGGRGKIYRGVLENGQQVAIKKSKAADQYQKFLNEITTISKINHRSVVKLLGYCLEVRVPMLVYEFIPNKTLFDLLYVKKETINLHVRLEIAFDSADALFYLHSAHSIIHGAVKSSNILLDANNKAKVSNFGASSLLPLDADQLAELVQSDLDPECISTRRLTDKSDVYSFGVVLLELITRKETKSLASSFVSAMNQNKLHDILDDEIVEVGTVDLLHEVAQLALCCVSLKREDRPTMKEVAEGLKILIKSKYHPWDTNKSEEAKSLLGDHEIS